MGKIFKIAKIVDLDEEEISHYKSNETFVYRSKQQLIFILISSIVALVIFSKGVWIEGLGFLYQSPVVLILIIVSLIAIIVCIYLIKRKKAILKISLEGLYFNDTLYKWDQIDSLQIVSGAFHSADLELKKEDGVITKLEVNGLSLSIKEISKEIANYRWTFNEKLDK